MAGMVTPTIVTLSLIEGFWGGCWAPGWKGGGEARPSSSSSSSLTSPCIKAMPTRNLSAYELARLATNGFFATITALFQSGILS